MEAKEKAEELINKFRWQIEIKTDFIIYGEDVEANVLAVKEHAKQCALVTVQEILNLIGEPERNEKGEALGITALIQPYWIKVREQIELQ